MLAVLQNFVTFLQGEVVATGETQWPMSGSMVVPNGTHSSNEADSIWPGPLDSV